MSNEQGLSILAISGSLRRTSLNTAALSAARELAPAGATVTLQTLHDIPPYDEDVRAEGVPEPVQRLRAAIGAADALLICTPEYNYSVPGVLKNAIDWASRPPDQPFDAKPIAIMGVSPGRLGTARAQYQLRQVFVFLNGLVLNRPEVMIAGANELFDPHGKLADDPTRERIRDLVGALVEWARRF